jgi:hypothetical protein
MSDESALLKKAKRARWAGRKMLVLLNEADVDRMPDAWREDFLKTLDDLSMHVDVVRALVQGDGEA